MMTKICSRIFLTMLTIMLIACEPIEDLTVRVSSSDDVDPTAEKAVEFVAHAEAQLSELGQEVERVAWVYSNMRHCIAMCTQN